VRFGLRVDGDRYSADFYCAEEAIEKLGRVEQQEQDALSGADAEIAKRVSGAVRAFKELLVGDALSGGFYGDIFPAAFADIAIHEISGDVEDLR
jgi:hypothetical protein